MSVLPHVTEEFFHSKSGRYYAKKNPNLETSLAEEFFNLDIGVFLSNVDHQEGKH